MGIYWNPVRILPRITQESCQEYAGSWFQNHIGSHVGIMQDPSNDPRKILHDIFTRAVRKENMTQHHSRNGMPSQLTKIPCAHIRVHRVQEELVC